MASNQPTLPGLKTPLENGEPVFILRARDPLAADLATLWAFLAEGETGAAIEHFGLMINRGPAKSYVTEPRSQDKIESAVEACGEIQSWRYEQGLPVWHYN
jgi:hypothetical protein